MTMAQELAIPNVLNGAVYVATTRVLLRSRSLFEGHLVGHEMPPERSVDINTKWDRFVTSCVLARRTATVEL